MMIYIVGGAVRDHLLGRTSKDRDFVVVGSTPAEMEAQGFRAVGKSFPVFLHPETHEEYALARIERKTGLGHQAFTFDFSSHVTLEEDLLRRDLTINAIAMSLDGQTFIDPYHGKKDLEQKILRHVSPHFREDPLRVLRVARFAALLPDFSIAAETTELLKEMSASGELAHLSAERVCMEIEKALLNPAPRRFFELLSAWGALPFVLPELTKLIGVMASPQYHPEGDSFTHTMLVLSNAKELAPHRCDILFSCLVHDLGKGETPAEILPKHTMHEKRGIPLVETVCKRLKVKNDWKDLAILVTRYHLQCHKIFEMRPSKVFDLLKKLDAFRRPERLKDFLLCCKADHLGKLQEHYPQAEYLQKAFDAALSAKKLALPELQEKYRDHGEELGKRLRTVQIKAIKDLKSILN